MSTNDSVPLAAIVYDFDGTLAHGDLPDHSFLPRMKQERTEFWKEVKRIAEANDADEILVYMQQMLYLATQNGSPITAAALQSDGKDVPLFDGVREWFDRINNHAKKINLCIEHYVVSSGIHEMIRGCDIYDKFEKVYASQFMYDETGDATWPGLAVNYTNKTQFLFRINKGVHNAWDNEPVNQWIPPEQRRIPFERMIFIGDGATDIPSMKMVRHQGGHSIAVFNPKDWSGAEGIAQDKIYRLISEDRANFVAPADYTNRSQLDIIVKGILGRFGG